MVAFEFLVDELTGTRKVRKKTRKEAKAARRKILSSGRAGVSKIKRRLF